MADRMTIYVLITLIYYPDAETIMTDWRRSKVHRKFRNLQGFIGRTLSRMEVWQGTYMVPKFILVTSHLKARRRPVWAVFPHKQEPTGDKITSETNNEETRPTTLLQCVMNA